MGENDTVAGGGAGLTRRTMLKLAATVTIGAGAGAGGAAAMLRRWNREAPPARYRFFNEAEAATLIAICEQIIPRDDAPGATDAGVIFYIDRQLSSVFARHQKTYRQGLASFASSCLKLNKTPFEKLTFEQQTAFLKLIEGSKAPRELWSDPTQQAFFNMVLEHTMQGFYGSPRHGGNRNYASYRMLGLEYPNIIGQNRYPAQKQG